MGGEKDNYTHTFRLINLLKQPECDIELDEHDVMWHDSNHLSDPEPEPDFDPVQYPTSGFGLSAVFAPEKAMTVRPARSLTGRIGSGPDTMAKSAPVNVPTWQKRSCRFEHVLDDVDEEGYDGHFEPPHEIVARSHVMTFSVFEGVGRTLKGRDLRRVRNAVFQQTGFLD